MRLASKYFRTFVPAAALAGGCVFGYRGAVPFAGEATLAGIDTVVLDLPPTDLSLLGDSLAIEVDWEGRFVSLGATPKDALRSAEQLDLDWESWAGILRVYAVMPPELEDISELEQLDVISAPYLAHEIRGAGSVFVSGIDAYLSIELASGNVEVFGGVEQVLVSTGNGSVELRTAAAVVVNSGAGPVTLELDDPRNTEVATTGPVQITVAVESDLAIDIADAGVIVVQLGQVAHVGQGSYQRTLGAGTRPMRVRAGGGRVDLTLVAAE